MALEAGTRLGVFEILQPVGAGGMSEVYRAKRSGPHRADLFAFGAMLHEMVTGRRAFDGESRASLIAAILDGEPPPVSTLQPISASTGSPGPCSTFRSNSSASPPCPGFWW